MESMIRVLGTTGSNQFRTVNIAPTGTAFPGGAVSYGQQVPTGAAGPSFETVQTSNYTGGTGPNNGLRTIVIRGYTGPA
jgi:hypothetical protein